MPTRIQPSMDLQLNVTGMGPAMMNLDHGLRPRAPDPVKLTRWQRLWAFLNKDIRDIWRDIRAARSRRS